MEKVNLSPFASGADPKRREGQLVFPHNLPRHLKQGAKEVRQDRKVVVYALNKGKTWYMIEAQPLGESWDEPGDGRFIGSTSRKIRERYGCQSDIHCLRKLLDEHQIPLLICRSQFEQKQVRKLDLFLK